MIGPYKVNSDSIISSGSARKHEFLDEHRMNLESEDNVEPQISLDFFNVDKILYSLIYISENIEATSCELQSEVINIMKIYLKNGNNTEKNIDKLLRIDQHAALELINIFQYTPHVQVLGLVLKVVNYWLKIEELSSNVWVSDGFVLPLVAMASCKNISTKLRENCINVFSKLIFKEKENVTKLVSCSKIMARFTELFKQSMADRYIISQFLDAYFLCATNYTLNDILILGDIFNMLPDLMETVYFSLLLSTTMSIDITLGNYVFMTILIQNTDIGRIFAEFYESQYDTRNQVVSLFLYFINSKNQALLDCCFRSFQWKWLIEIFKNKAHSMEKRDATNLVKSIILIWPDSLKLNGAENIMDYLCFFFNNGNYFEKSEVLKNVAEILNVQNYNLYYKILDNNFIEEAVKHMQAQESAIRILMAALHQIAVFAEHTQRTDIIEKMNESGFMEALIGFAGSEDKAIAEMAQGFLNDTNISIFHSFVAVEEKI